MGSIAVTAHRLTIGRAVRPPVRPAGPRARQAARVRDNPGMSTPSKPVVPRERAARPIAAGVDIGHVHMKTADLDRIEAFYVGILGFDVVVRMPDALFISSGGYHHHLAFNTWESKGGSPPPRGTTGLYHVAIRYPTRAALGDALARLSRRRLAAQRRERPRHARGALSERSRRQRPRAVLGPARGRVAARRRGPSHVRERRARPERHGARAATSSARPKRRAKSRRAGRRGRARRRRTRGGPSASRGHSDCGRSQYSSRSLPSGSEM